MKKGKCPHCKERFNYTRDDIEPVDDMIFVDCTCQECNKEFTEIFTIKETQKKR